MTNHSIGYAADEIEPKIAPHVKAGSDAGFVTFASCEGHIEGEDQRFASVAFYAHEAEARSVHECLLRYRERLACSWCLRGGFVIRRESSDLALGWTLESCGIIEQSAQLNETEFVARTVEAGWNTDIPLLVQMFGDVKPAAEGGS